MQNYSRPLDTKEAVEDFLTKVLNFDYTAKHEDIISKIIDGENGINKYADLNSQTLRSLSMREKSHRSESARWNLRSQIIEELLTLERLSDDDGIELTKGGALPQTLLKSEKTAFILMGLPASGKSSIASSIADDYGAVLIDSDLAKRKLPEYSKHTYGATLVHAESDEITFGFGSGNPNKLKDVYKRCISANHNIVIPKIGQNPGSIIDLATVLKKTEGYKVHLILVSLSKQAATKRAAIRFYETGRYVPLGLIFDWYGNDPSHSYYYLRCKHHDLFESFGVLSTLNRPVAHTDIKGESPVAKYNYLDITLKLP